MPSVHTVRGGHGSHTGVGCVTFAYVPEPLCGVLEDVSNQLYFLQWRREISLRESQADNL